MLTPHGSHFSLGVGGWTRVGKGRGEKVVGRTVVGMQNKGKKMSDQRYLGGT